ncbi:MAG TPA: OB-fold domain-containing protein [Pseudolabrys sp.]|nr:OB-fold domain-containing protein [Pseudolabrys sp.]
MTLLKRAKPRVGVYEKPFWAYVQKDELRLQKCISCGRFRYPPAAVCAECLSDQYEWTKVNGRARVVSWAIFHRKYLDLPVPYIVVSVALEEGPMLIGNMDVEHASSLRVDLPVEVRFEDAEGEDGAPWRIFQWTPAT